MKQHWPSLKILAVEPASSPVISGGALGSHSIQGIGTGFIPANLHTSVLDGVIKVELDQAHEFARQSARLEGLLVGISSGATLAAISQTNSSLPKDAVILGFNYDSVERYLSVPDFLPA